MGFKTPRELRLEKVVTKSAAALEANCQMMHVREVTESQLEEAKMITESAINMIMDFWENDVEKVRL